MLEPVGYYVYGYFRLDTNELFYIGKGHGKRCFNINGRDDHFINICNKYDVAVVILINNLTEEEAFMYEELAIQILVEDLDYSINIPGYRSNNKKIQHLVNKTWGGEGASGASNPASKPVICLTTNEVFGCTVDGSKKYNLWEYSVSDCCRHKCKTAGKHPITNEPLVWLFYEDYLQLNNEQIQDIIKNATAPNIGSSRKIYCVELDKEFNSIKEAENYLGVYSSSIANCVCGLANTALGYHWCYLEDKNNYVIPQDKNKRAIKCIELDLIFDSAVEACNYIGDGKYMSSISACARGEKLTAYGYHWCYVDLLDNYVIPQRKDTKGKNNPMYGKTGEANPNSKKVKCIELDLIFDSIGDANVYLGKPRKNGSIGMCARGKTKTAWNYHWCYVEDLDNYVIPEKYKHTITEQEHQRRSDSRKNYWKNNTVAKEDLSKRVKGGNNPCAKKVRCIELDLVFDCCRDANEYLGKPRNSVNINTNAQGRSKSAWGYHWEFVTEEQEELAL